MKTPILFSSLLILLIFGEVNAYKHDVCVCAIFQNEARFLKEWIEYHKLIGVEKFYLYNNNSSDDYRSVLNPYAKKGIVELIEWPHKSEGIEQWNNVQTSAYQDALSRTRGTSKWLAIIDIDEFIVLKQTTSLQKFLKEYEAYSGVCVNWQMFGTSGVEVVPPGKLMVELLTKRAVKDHPEHFTVKSIVKPDLVRTCVNPHFVFYTAGYSVTPTEQIPFIGAISPTINTEKIQINHYWLRDKEFMKNTKYPRLLLLNPAITLEFLEARDEEYSKEEDLSIHPVLPKLKKAMFLKTK